MEVFVNCTLLIVKFPGNEYNQSKWIFIKALSLNLSVFILIVANKPYKASNLQYQDLLFLSPDKGYEPLPKARSYFMKMRQPFSF